MAGLDKPRFVTSKTMQIAGVHAPFTPATLKDIPKLWEEFRSEVALMSGVVGKTEYGLWFNVLAKGGQLFYLAGVEIGQFAPAPQIFTRTDLRPRSYAVFAHRGDVTNTRATIDAALSELPKLGKEHFGAYAGEPDFFERYVDGYQAAKSGTGAVEIWVPLKA